MNPSDVFHSDGRPKIGVLCDPMCAFAAPINPQHCHSCLSVANPTTEREYMCVIKDKNFALVPAVFKLCPACEVAADQIFDEKKISTASFLTDGSSWDEMAFYLSKDISARKNK